MKILIVTDAWRPQINGVVRTLQRTVRELEAMGHAVEILSPEPFRARVFRSADVKVFTSVTDTFGLVLVEAMASGTPVAAFPVAGPIHVVGDSAGGVLDADPRRACLAALALPRAGAREHAMQFCGAVATRQFVDALPMIGRPAAGALRAA